MPYAENAIAYIKRKYLEIIYERKIERTVAKVVGLVGDKVQKRDLLHIPDGSLPSPFSPEEELSTVRRYLAGDEEARLELIEHNLRLVVYIAKRFDNTGVDMDDLVSIGTIGLIKAVGSYNPDKNIKLATFASRCIENEILMHLAQDGKNAHGSVFGRTAQRGF